MTIVSKTPSCGVTFGRNWRHQLRLRAYITIIIYNFIVLAIHLYCHYIMIVKYDRKTFIVQAGNTKGESITAPLTSCLAGLEAVVWQLTFFVFIHKTDLSKPVKQEVNCTVILPPLVFPGTGHPWKATAYSYTFDKIKKCLLGSNAKAFARRSLNYDPKRFITSGSGSLPAGVETFTSTKTTSLISKKSSQRLCQKSHWSQYY
jgi:hypothetical protein